MSGIQNVIGGAGIVLGQVGAAGGVNPADAPTRTYRVPFGGTYVRNRRQLGDTLAGTLVANFLPPIYPADFKVIPLVGTAPVTYIKLSRINIVLWRNRAVYNQDSDFNFTLYAPLWRSAGWGEAPANPEVTSFSSSFSLVDFSVQSTNPTVIDPRSSSSWDYRQTGSNGRAINPSGRGRGQVSEELALANFGQGNQFYSILDPRWNTIFWDNHILKQQPEFDYGNQSTNVNGAQSGFVLTDAYVEARQMGVQCRQVNVAITNNATAINRVATSQNSLFHLSCSFQVADVFLTARSYIDFIFSVE